MNGQRRGRDGQDHAGIQTVEPRLLRLFRAQHREDVSRARLSRGTVAWDDATTRLDTLNRQLRHLASTGTLPRERLSGQLDLELDSRPEEDLAFRNSVVACVRQTVLARLTEDLAARSRDRLDASEAKVRATQSLLDRIEARLRADYPGATFDARASTRTTISLVAERDGLIA